MDEFIKSIPENVSRRFEELKSRKYSDLSDASGNQYVDLVQEGGGVLGIGLVGYIYAMEQCGIRFFDLAGTSAGAITTITLASLGKLEEPKALRMLEILGTKDLFDLVDGTPAIRRILRSFLNNGGFWSKARVAFRLNHVLGELRSHFGLNPGDKFIKWIEGILAENGIHTLKDLEDLRSKLPDGLKNTATGASFSTAPRLAVIASDITTSSKIEFPKMAELYWQNRDQVSPALFVRASMSIPFFFRPMVIKNPPAGVQVKEKWVEFAKYRGDIPDEIKFVDGGMLSNFPINVFHRKDNLPPVRPTFGARLSTYRDRPSETGGLLGFCGALIKTMRQIHDYDFLLRNPDYKQLICRIDANEEFSWLDFNMSKDEQIKLFNLGILQAVEFLKNFNWESYKRGRSFSRKSIVV